MVRYLGGRELYQLGTRRMYMYTCSKAFTAFYHTGSIKMEQMRVVDDGQDMLSIAMFPIVCGCIEGLSPVPSQL